MWLPSARLPPGGPPACQDSISNSYRTAYGGRIHIRTPKDKVTERVQKLRTPYLQGPQAPDRTPVLGTSGVLYRDCLPQHRLFFFIPLWGSMEHHSSETCGCGLDCNEWPRSSGARRLKDSPRTGMASQTSKGASEGWRPGPALMKP